MGLTFSSISVTACELGAQRGSSGSAANRRVRTFPDDRHHIIMPPIDTSKRGLMSAMRNAGSPPPGGRNILSPYAVAAVEHSAFITAVACPSTSRLC